jgi:hypothetical protein
VVSLHDFGDADAAAAAGIRMQGWQGMSKDRRGMGEVKRVCKCMSRNSMLCYVGIFQVGKTDGGRLVVAECGASKGWVTCMKLRGWKGLMSEVVRMALSQSELW